MFGVRSGILRSFNGTATTPEETKAKTRADKKAAAKAAAGGNAAQTDASSNPALKKGAKVYAGSKPTPPTNEKERGIDYQQSRPTFLASKPEVELDKVLRFSNHKESRLHPEARERYATLTQPPEPLKYKLHPVPAEVNYNNRLGVVQEIPWHVVRTKSENLPVYRRYTHGRTSNYTEIRLVQGNVDDFVTELKKVVSNSEVKLHLGKIRVRGIHKESVMRWLYLLGF